MHNETLLLSLSCHEFGLTKTTVLVVSLVTVVKTVIQKRRYRAQLHVLVLTFAYAS